MSERSSAPVHARYITKAIILDLDDTILDSGDPDLSWRRICAEFAGNFEGVTPGPGGVLAR